MKAGRIVSILLLVLLIVYLLLFHGANPVLVELPLLLGFVPPLPVSYVVIFVLVVGWLVGWLPSRIVAWRRSREIRRLEKRIAELTPNYAPLPAETTHQTGEFPVIPDRGAQFRAEPFDDDEAG